MSKKLCAAALVAAFSFASIPMTFVAAHAQSGATEPPTAPDPSDAKDMAASTGGMSKDSMSSSKSMKKMKHHHMKKHSSSM